MEASMFKTKYLPSLAFILAVFTGQAFAKDNLWFFTANEIANAYRYQLQFGARLRTPLEPRACFYGQKEFLANYQGNRFAAPCRFVDETVRQLKELLESGAAKYLFPLDVDYADLAVPVDVYRRKYKHLSKNEILPVLLRDPALIAVYRTAVHLDQQMNEEGSEMPSWGGNRIVTGFYDGRPNRIVARASNSEVDEFQDLVRLGSFNMMAHFLGELTFVAGENVVTFDLSFDNDRSSNEEIVAVSEVAR